MLFMEWKNVDILDTRQNHPEHTMEVGMWFTTEIQTTLKRHG